MFVLSIKQTHGTGSTPMADMHDWTSLCAYRVDSQWPVCMTVLVLTELVSTVLVLTLVVLTVHVLMQAEGARLPCGCCQTAFRSSLHASPCQP